MFATRARVPFLPQAANAECGAACLAMIMRRYGIDTSVREVRSELDVGRDGASMAEIARYARSYGMQAQGMLCDPEALAELPLPAVAAVTGSHFVVVERALRGGRWDVVDPARGPRRLDAGAFAAEFVGVVLLLRPAGRTRPVREPSRLRFLWQFVPRVPATFALIIAMSLLLTLLGLVPAGLTAFVVDSVVPAAAGSSPLVVLAAGALVVLACHLALTLARAEILQSLEDRVDDGLTSSFLRHLLSLPLGWFQLRSTGDLLARAAGNAAIREMVTSQAVAAVLDVGSVVLYLVVLFGVAPDIAAVVLVVALAQAVLVTMTARRTRDLAMRGVTADAEEQSCLVEIVAGVESIKAAGAEDAALRRWSTLFGRSLAAGRRSALFDVRVDGVSDSLDRVLALALVVICAHKAVIGELTIGRMLALITVGGALMVPLKGLIEQVRELQTAQVHLARLEDVIVERPEQEPRPGPPRIAVPISGRIEAHQATFAYPGSGGAAVRDASLCVQAGATVALVGPSGSGKSTLARMLVGLHPLHDGQIRFGVRGDGRWTVDLRDADLTALRRQCGVVTQDPAIFSGSIIDTIRFAAPAATQAEVEAAARIACLHDEIAAMPLGYDTVLGEGGDGLSGGQRQRMALARAVLGRPPVLVLDEATSALDTRTEAAVHANLRSLTGTRIVVAHRLSTVRDADLILVLDGGRIVERGTHTALRNAGGLYAALVARQVGA